MQLICSNGHRHETDDPRNAHLKAGDRCNAPSHYDPSRKATHCRHTLEARPGFGEFTPIPELIRIGVESWPVAESITFPAPCTECHGTGIDPAYPVREGYEVLACDYCEGSGRSA